METRSAKRKRLQNNASKTSDHNVEDRISDLPDEILHHIFFFLPLKSIAQTSVVSKRWNNIWYSYPNLDFTTVENLTDTHLETPKRRSNNGTDQYIDQILTLLEKHADVRVLKFRSILTFSRLTSLIRHAVKCNVQELDVEVSTCDYFTFSRSLIHCTSLRSLRLKSWRPGFRLAPIELMKEGFQTLSTLSLSRAIFYRQPSLDNLFTFSSFPSLKNLHLEACFGLTRLRIECPSLENLCVKSCFHLQHLEICLQKLEKLSVSSCFDAYSACSGVKIDAPMLKVMVWSYNAITETCILSKLTSLQEAFLGFSLLHNDLNEAKIRSISNFMHGISHNCHSLVLECQSIEILSTRSVLLCPFGKLKSLELSIGFNKHHNTGLASVFKSCPAIHTVVINIIGDYITERRKWKMVLWQSASSEEERYWESQTQYLKSFFQHLKVVKINGFTECTNNISLLKFLLKHGKVLHQVFLCSILSRPRDKHLRKRIRSHIMGFSRASSNANIIFK